MTNWVREVIWRVWLTADRARATAWYAVAEEIARRAELVLGVPRVLEVVQARKNTWRAAADAAEAAEGAADGAGERRDVLM
jgi:hypothetical protein